MKRLKLPCVILSLLLSFGCNSEYSYFEIVECDSGFSTGLVYSAFMMDGEVRWKTRIDSSLSRRKMQYGETCSSSGFRILNNNKIDSE